jgi:hypothetical protein
MSSRAPFLIIGSVSIVVLVVSQLFPDHTSRIVARSVRPLSHGQQRDADERFVKQVFRLLLPAATLFTVVWLIWVLTYDE